MKIAEILLGKDAATTVVGLAVAVAALFAKFGLHVDPEILALIVTVGVLALGRVSGEKGAKDVG